MQCYRRITLHVGLPKCASSAFQGWADANRAALLAQGLDYPEAHPSQIAPKHQEIVHGIMGGSMAGIEALLRRPSDNLLMSTEGMSNMLYEASPSALERFCEMMGGGCDTILLMVRDGRSWLRSYWKQCLTNPVMPALGYGLALTLDEFAQLPRVQRLADRASLRMDLATAYGARRLVEIDAAGNWSAQVAEVLEIDLAGLEPPARRHASIGDAEAELIRQINGMGLPADQRSSFLAMLQIATGTKNDTLSRHTASSTPSLGLHRKSLAEALDVLRPADDRQLAVIDRLRYTLESV